MRIEDLRVTELSARPSDTSGLLVTMEVADAEQLRSQVLRGSDDGAADWPLAKRYGEICDRLSAQEAELACLRAALDDSQQTVQVLSQTLEQREAQLEEARGLLREAFESGQRRIYWELIGAHFEESSVQPDYPAWLASKGLQEPAQGEEGKPWL